MVPRQGGFCGVLGYGEESNSGEKIQKDVGKAPNSIANRGKAAYIC
jgi:hypothetical protein